MSVARNIEYHVPTENVENVESGQSAIANEDVTQRSDALTDVGHSISDTADIPMTPEAVTSFSFAEQTTESGDPAKPRDAPNSNEICGSAGNWQS